MHDQRIDLFGHLFAEQQEAQHIHNPHRAGKPQQCEHIASGHTHSQESSGDVHAKQQRGGVVYKA